MSTTRTDIRVLGIGPESVECPLPACRLDVLAMMRLYRARNYQADVLTGDVVPFPSIVVAKDRLYGSDNAILHHSHHGLLSRDKKTWYLWLGDKENCIPLEQYVEQIVAPLQQRCGAVTILMDACFAGRATKKAGVKKKPLPGFPKTVGDVFDEDMATDADVASQKPFSGMNNVAVIAACSARQVAFADCCDYAHGGFGTLHTDGLSVFSQRAVDVIGRAYEPCSKIDSPQGKALHLANELRQTVADFLRSEDTDQWRQSPPRSPMMTVTWKIRPEHKAVLIDRLP